MASSYSANQYDDAFRARRLQQYTVPKQYKQHPSTRSGNTKIVGDDLGHILPGVPRSQESPWGNFQGTWDLPTRIPGNHLSNACARKCDQPCGETFCRQQDACPDSCSRSPPQAAGSGRCEKPCAEACKTDCGPREGECPSACQEACQQQQQQCKSDSARCGPKDCGSGGCQ